MSWPLSQDYNESIQDPRNSFADAELKTGEAVANPLGIPLPRSGNFADVYEVRCPSGSRWAVKCFTRQVSGLSERYSEISKYLRLAKLPFTVDFTYLEQGIRVRGQWYPILKMQWVEGFVLNEFVRDNLDKKPILLALGQIWLRMAKRLRESYIAHCDLQHGNVLFVPGSTANSLAVKLIDYDGMCVPSLVGTKSGEVGHPAFQHPERLRTGAYDQEVDRFSLLLIAASLRCLAIGGRSLWQRYDNGDNLLFRQSDLQSPTESPLFQELLEIPDAQARSLVKELFRACRGPLDKVPLLTDLIPDEKPVTKVTTATATAKQAAGTKGPDWDFNENESAPSVVKKPRESGHTPKWIWAAAAGAAAVLLLGVGVGAGLMMRNGPTKKQENPIAQNKPEAIVPRPKPKPPVPVEDRQPLPKDNRPIPVIDKNNPPPNPPPAPPLGPEVLKDALLLMNFEKDTFYEKDGKTYVRDLSGHGNDGLCDNVAFTAEGKAGGGLASNGGSLRLKRSLINRLPNYTITAWLRVENAEGRDRGIYVRATEQLKESNYWFWTDGGGGLGANAWHQDHQPVKWIDASAGQRVIAKEQWVFVAAVLRNGATGKGELRLMADDRVFNLQSQMVGGAAEGSFDYLGVGIKAILDEVTLSPRALSDSEIQAIRQRGLAGKPLETPTRPPAEAVVAKPPPPPPSPVEMTNIAWEKPTDPDGDCAFKNVGGKLTLELPGKDHDLDPDRSRANAPRVLYVVEGDFTAQVRVGGEFQPSPDSTAAGRSSFLGAGLLLWINEKTFIRLERAAMQKNNKKFRIIHYAAFSDGKRQQTGQTGGTFPLPLGEEIYLRLERRGEELVGLFSDNGQGWSKLPALQGKLSAKVKIGLVACSTSSQPFAPTFDQFQLKEGSGRMQYVNLPLPNATRPVVVKPPPPKPATRRFIRKPVPDPAAIEAAIKDLRERHKNEYTNNRNQLISVLFKDLNAARNDQALRFAVWREVRDIQAENNVFGGLGTARQLAQQFDVNVLEMKADALDISMKSSRINASDITDAALALVDQAIGEKNYAVLARLVKDLRISAAKLRPDDAKRPTAERVLAHADSVQRERDKLRPELRTLEDKPDDAKANLAVGKFHCVARSDWEEGLPFLTRGGDPALKALAEKDLAISDDPAAQVALGDDWRKYAGSVNSKSFKTACQKRAHYWYQQAAGVLKGEKLKSVQKTMTTLAKSVPELRDPWWQFGVYDGTTLDPTGTLRVRPPRGIRTRQAYRGPLDITVVARTMKTDLNISIVSGGRLVIGQDFNGKSDRLQVFRPDAAPESIGSRAVEKMVALPANGWFTVRWQITPAGMKVWLDGEVVFEEAHANDLSEKYTVMVHCGAAPIELKSVLVKRGEAR